MRQEFSAQGWERLHTALTPAGSGSPVPAHLARGRGDLPGTASIDATDLDPAPFGAAQTHFPSLGGLKPPEVTCPGHWAAEKTLGTPQPAVWRVDQSWGRRAE